MTILAQTPDGQTVEVISISNTKAGKVALVQPLAVDGWNLETWRIPVSELKSLAIAQEVQDA